MTSTEWWQSTLDLVGTNAWARAGAILVAGIVAAKLVNWFVSGVLKTWASFTSTEFDDQLIAALRRPVFLTVVLISAWLALLELPLEPVIVDKVLLPVLKTFALLVWSVFFFTLAALLIGVAGRHHERFPVINERTVPLFGQVAKLIIAGGVVYFLCLAWGIPVTGWLASAGVAGLAIGFAAKDTLANLFAGIFILADAPYQVGDFIILDSGERGEVQHIGLRSTRLLTRDDIEITVPNAVIANAKIINESGGPWEKERVRLKVGVAYGSDLDQVHDVLMEVAHSQPEILDDPEPRVRVRGFGDSAIDHELLGWIEQPVLRGRVLDALYRRVYAAFGEAAIEIPYPRHEVVLKGGGGEGRAPAAPGD